MARKCYFQLFIRRTLLSSDNSINSFLMKYPKQSSILLACIKTISADLVVQIYFDKKSWNNIDWLRTSVFGVFGFCYLGCFQYWLYNIIYFKWFPGVSFRSTLQKTLFDQFIKSPVIYWPTFYFLQCSIHERNINIHTMNSVINTWKRNVFNDTKACLGVWIPAHMIMFGIMPLHLRLPYNAAVSMFWCGIVSIMHGKYDKDVGNNYILNKQMSVIGIE
eukprot:234993_1